MPDQCFIPLNFDRYQVPVPENLNNPFGNSHPEIVLFAAAHLQEFIIKNQADWSHNFGFTEGKDGKVKGKMFGVLVVQKTDKEIGYLSTFSGKLDGAKYDSRFVPALFDVTQPGNFLDIGMTELSKMGQKILQLKKENTHESAEQILKIKEARKNKSYSLQHQLFDQYHFLNSNGVKKSLISIFSDYSERTPAGGAGECAAPKLLHYAFENDYKPLAIAEFWWGNSTIYKDKMHGEFYPACEEKCRPILSYMLSL